MRRYCGRSPEVATSVQFGSRARLSREKVHTSVTSRTVLVSPSTTAPAASLVAEMNCAPKATVISAMRFLSAAWTILASLKPTKVKAVCWRAASRWATAASKARKTSSLSSGRSVARSPLAKAGDDHLIGLAAAGEEMLGLEVAVGELDVEQAARHRIGGAAVDDLGARHGRDGVGGGLRRRLGRVRQAIVFLWRALVAGAAAEHGVQPEQDEARDRDQHDVEELGTGHSRATLHALASSLDPGAAAVQTRYMVIGMRRFHGSLVSHARSMVAARAHFPEGFR